MQNMSCMAPTNFKMAQIIPMIAVVDDDRSITKSLARLLRLSGYGVDTFGSAQEFLNRLGISLPRCLVMDVQMPEMNGFELQSRMKELGHAVPIVFITAHDTPQTRAAASQSGAIALLFKPFQSTALLAAIEEAIAVPEEVT